MKQINLTDKQIDKLLTYCESMIGLCDDPEEIRVYEEMIEELTK